MTTERLEKREGRDITPYPGWMMLCLVCGKVYEFYPYRQPCQGTTYAHRLDEVVEWAEPGKRASRIRLEALGMQIESEINGRHRNTTG